MSNAPAKLPPRPSDQALLAAIQAAGKLDVQGASLKRGHHAYSTSFAIEELAITDRAGRNHVLIFKDLSDESLIGSARTFRPKFLYEPTREILVYRHLLDGQVAGSASVIAAVIDRASSRYWLIIEHIAGGQLRHVGEVEAWEEAARWLARLHTRYEHGVRGLHQVPLLRYDAGFFARFFDRFFQSTAGPSALSKEATESRETLEKAMHQAGEVLADFPATLVHGEYYPANVLLRSRVDGDKTWSVCPVDWELAGVGPGVLDLAALTAGDWPEQSRRRMILAYQDELTNLGHPPPALRALEQAMDACRVMTAIQWLGWSAGWTAPPDQARDWLRDALEASQRLLKRP